MNDLKEPERNVLERELGALLRQVEDWLEKPMIVLAFLWLALIIAEFIWDPPPAVGWFVSAIWVIFILDFLLRFILAPRKTAYIKRNWLTAVSLLLPALRLFRIVQSLRLLRAVRATRGLRLVRVVSSLNRGMHALRASMGRRGFSYVMTSTLIVSLVGAAGMYAFENILPGGGGFETYWDALWWTAMLLTTIGSEYWPQTTEGRLLCLFLSIYSLGILGYITATLASFFVGRDAESKAGEVAGAQVIEALRAEIKALPDEMLQRMKEG